MSTWHNLLATFAGAASVTICSAVISTAAIAGCGVALEAIGRLPPNSALPSVKRIKRQACSQEEWRYLAYNSYGVSSPSQLRVPEKMAEIEGVWVIDTILAIAGGKLTANHILRAVEISAGPKPNVGQVRYHVHRVLDRTPFAEIDSEEDYTVSLGAGPVRLTTDGWLDFEEFSLRREEMEQFPEEYSNTDKKPTPEQWRAIQDDFYGDFTSKVKVLIGDRILLFSKPNGAGGTYYWSATRRDQESIEATVSVRRAFEMNVSSWMGWPYQLCLLHAIDSNHARINAEFSPIGLKQAISAAKEVAQHSLARNIALRNKDKDAYSSHQDKLAELRQSAPFLALQSALKRSPSFQCPNIDLSAR